MELRELQETWNYGTPMELRDTQETANYGTPTEFRDTHEITVSFFSHIF